MAKTKTDDLPKGTEEMSAEEQKAAKGGATRFATMQAAAVMTPTLGSATTIKDTSRLAEEAAGTIEESPTLDPTIREPIKR